MRLPAFDYVEPGSVKEASSILLDDPHARILAGGTDLLVNMKHRVETPSRVVNIKRIGGLSFVEAKGDAVRIGALTPLKKLAKSPVVREKLSALSSAACSVGAYHHQNMGTVGGNICQQNRCKYFNQSQWWRSARPLCYKAGGETCYVVNKRSTCYSSYCGDLAPALLALDGKVVLESRNTRREIPLESLFSGDGKAPLTLQEGEILTEIVIPLDSAEGSSTYLKFANRGSIDFPIVGMALWASPEWRDFRVSFTAVDRRPIRTKRVERFLEGRGLAHGEAWEEAAGVVSQEATPVKTSLYSPSHKRKMMGLLLKQALVELGERRVQ